MTKFSFVWQYECCIGDCGEIYCCCDFVLLGTSGTNAWLSLREFYTLLHSSLHLNCHLWMSGIRQQQFAQFKCRLAGASCGLTLRRRFHLLFLLDIAVWGCWMARQFLCDVNKTGSGVPWRAWRQMLEWAVHPRTVSSDQWGWGLPDPWPPGTTWRNSELLHSSGICRLKHNSATPKKCPNSAFCVKA